jgi:N-acetylglucosaminyldiphosphoundecaprenol N-acetyl-beta-D-mannosaminyltransferase
LAECDIFSYFAIELQGASRPETRKSSLELSHRTVLADSSYLDRGRVGSLLVDNTTINQAGRFATDLARRPARLAAPALLTSVNAQAVLVAEESPRFAEIMNSSALSIADGMSIVIASRLLGTPLHERIAGVDLVDELCKLCAREELSVYFIGGRPGAASQTAEILVRRHPGLRVAGIDCPPYGFETDPSENQKVLRRIRLAAPDLLFVALGTPKQEYWTAEHLSDLKVAVAIPVGAAFEMIAGLVPRAPRWLQSIGMEWLFRLALEPLRLWRRYLIGNPRFIKLVVRQFLDSRRRIPASDRISNTSIEGE